MEDKRRVPPGFLDNGKSWRQIAPVYINDPVTYLKYPEM